jgi:thiamine biosynthesis lipoprotein
MNNMLKAERSNFKVTDKFINRATYMSFPPVGNLSEKKRFLTSQNDRNKISERIFAYKLFNNRRASCLLLLSICCMLLTVACACVPQKERVFRKSKVLMDTLVTITVVSGTEDEAEKATDKAFAEIERIEKLSSFYSPESEISLINKNAGINGVKVSSDILNLLSKALYVSEKTGGAFDVTIGPLSVLYDFHKKIRPDDRVVKKRLSLVNYRNMIINTEESTVFLRNKGMLIDPGGIAKGYAADRAEEVLKKSGILSGIVSVAGDIKTFGVRPDGKPWKIGIRNPDAGDMDDDVMATVELSNMAISTSGDYERYFMLDGVRYHHLLSPKTGLPSRECRSVTIITREVALTDAFSTAVFILGHEKGMKVLEERGFEGLIVDGQNNIHTTKGIRGKIEFKSRVSQNYHS